MPGIQKFVRLAANLAVASNAVLANTLLVIPIAANQRLTGTATLFITVGATGGIRLSLTAPAGGASYAANFVLVNNGASTVAGAFQAAAAAFTNALANAGTHQVTIEFDIVNGSTAGNVTLQFAQNTSDVLTATLLAGSNIVAIQS